MLVYLITESGATYIAHTDSVKELVKEAYVKIVKVIDEKGTVIYDRNV